LPKELKSQTCAFDSETAQKRWVHFGRKIQKTAKKIEKNAKRVKQTQMPPYLPIGTTDPIDSYVTTRERSVWLHLDQETHVRSDFPRTACLSPG
jgi:hypothetical protein